MSVVGFDIGCDFSKIAVAHRKQIQIVPNELTKLITPTLTAFSPKERHFGDGALTQFTRNYQHTISQCKRFLGRRADDPSIGEEAAFWLPGVSTGALPDGRFGINVETSQGPKCLAPEQILSGFLGRLKKFTGQFLGGVKVTDCVIACPSYFDDAQRRALLTAAKLAELKVLRLLEEPTAIALNYGILRNLPENETQRVVFVDIGYASTQVAVVDFVRGKLTVRYKAANPFVGGRNMDRSIYEIFRQQWAAKHGTNIDQLPKQKHKLLQSAKKIKKLLTGNKDAVWTLDCFHDDHDFPLSLTREEMEQSCDEQKVFEGILRPLEEALEATKGDGVKIHSCEIVGGPSRVPVAQRRILDAIQKYEPEVKALSTTLNGDECVARGAALMCAMLSPNFRVRDFQVQDILTWPVTIAYPSGKEGGDDAPGDVEQLIMQRGHPQPCTAKVMFNKSKNFVFKLGHPAEFATDDATVSVQYPFATNKAIGEFNVQLVALSENAVQNPKVKLLLDINKQGLLDWPKASLIEYVKREPAPEPKASDKKGADKKGADKKAADKKSAAEESKAAENADAAAEQNTNSENHSEEPPQNASSQDPEDHDVKMEDATAAAADAADAANAADSGSKMEVDDDDAAEPEAKKGDDKKVKKKDKRKVTRSLLITGNFFNELSASAFNAMFELEAALLNVDRIVFETDEAKNDLETYVYALRDKIDDSHREYIAEADREALSSQLTAMEDWVYEEGDSANKTQFLERLKQLKDIGDPMEYRKWEHEHRETRAANLKRLIGKYQQWPLTEDEQYAHIPQEKRQEVLQCANDADKWLSGELIKQDKMAKHEAPSLKCSHIDNKYRAVYEQCNKIVTTPKPPPPPKEEEQGGDDKKEEAVANGGAAPDAKKEDAGDDAAASAAEAKGAAAEDSKSGDIEKQKGDDAAPEADGAAVDGMDVE